jgi:hypothetical protein
MSEVHDGYDDASEIYWNKMGRRRSTATIARLNMRSRTN